MVLLRALSMFPTVLRQSDTHASMFPHNCAELYEAGVFITRRCCRGEVSIFPSPSEED